MSSTSTFLLVLASLQASMAFRCPGMGPSYPADTLVSGSGPIPQVDELVHGSLGVLFEWWLCKVLFIKIYLFLFSYFCMFELLAILK